MNCNHPLPSQIGSLKSLWQEAFGDSDTFLDGFWRTAFASQRCLCISEEGEIVSALYWLDCEYVGKQIAYIYAVATAKAFRGKGYCHALMADAHRILLENGYAAAVLVPGNENLVRFYEEMGYRPCGGIHSFSTLAESPAAPLRAVTATEYGRLRRNYLPVGSIIQEGESLDFLETYAQLFAGEDFLLALYPDGDTAVGLEFLGNPHVAPGILFALGYPQGFFRTSGTEPFALWLPFEEMPTPTYLGLAFD